MPSLGIIASIIAIIAGIILFIWPHIISYIVAVYLVIIGIVGVNRRSNKLSDVTLLPLQPAGLIGNFADVPWLQAQLCLLNLSVEE